MLHAAHPGTTFQLPESHCSSHHWLFPHTPSDSKPSVFSIPKQHNHTRQEELSGSAQAETCSSGCSSQPNVFKRECSCRNRLRCEAACFPFNGHQLMKAKLFALFLAIPTVRCSVSMLCFPMQLCQCLRKIPKQCPPVCPASVGWQLGVNQYFYPMRNSNISALLFCFCLGQGELKYLKSIWFGVFLSFLWGKQILGFGNSEKLPCESAQL